MWKATVNPSDKPSMESANEGDDCKSDSGGDDGTAGTVEEGEDGGDTAEACGEMKEGKDRPIDVRVYM